jgi:hypothetical protein
MEDDQWRRFFITCAEVLGDGDSSRRFSKTWCAFTTFDRLSDDAGYFTYGLPRLRDIESAWIKDASSWSQPIPFSKLAHLIVPKSFYWEAMQPDGKLEHGTREQDIIRLSERLVEADIPHRLTELVLEIKLY